MWRDAPRPPVRIERVLDEPEQVRELVLRNSPYWPVYRYFASAAEREAAGVPAGTTRVPAWFRGNWALDRPLTPGVEPFFANPRFIEAARALYGFGAQAVVRQQLVYVNLTLPAADPDPGHVDVPSFRGIGRDRFPVWLLAAMGRSGLFEPWRIRIATAVSWWYEGEGGAFRCWPQGLEAASVAIPPRSNTALVGENERMYHRVERVGAEDARLPLEGLSLAAELVAKGGDWLVRDAGRTLASVPFEAVRISISWKAEIFADAAEARLADDHLDDLGIDEVWSRFARDLRARAVPVEPGPAPLENAGFIAALGEVYSTRVPRSPRGSGDAPARRAGTA
jgi:hypothetical protein